MWENKARDGEVVILHGVIRKHISDVTKTHARNDGGLVQVVIKTVNTGMVLTMCHALL